MKRTLSVLLVIMVSIATAVTLRAETDESKPLSAKQWQRAIAIVGQNAALDGRYGHPESEPVQGIHVPSHMGNSGAERLQSIH